MSRELREDYLWDRSGPVDPEVARLERALGRFGHRVQPAARSRARRRVAALAAAAAVVGSLGVWFALDAGRAVPLTDVFAADAGEWIRVRGAPRELRLGDVGELTLAPGSDLQIRRVDAELAELFLQRGELSAFVSLDARPRFFQVETPSTRCVDLGCQFVLRVDDDGTTHVVVTSGEVAFATGDGGEVRVPHGAECRATSSGVGTPRFTGSAPGLRRAIDEFDAGRAAPRAVRERLFAAIVAAPLEERDSLTLWHLLADRELEIRKLAEKALIKLVGFPDIPPTPSGDIDIEEWHRHLEPSWW